VAYYNQGMQVDLVRFFLVPFKYKLDTDEGKKMFSNLIQNLVW